MTKEELIISQKNEREKILKSILESKAKKRIIVAGPGTGKTFTFSEILKLNPSGRNIAMTFIRLLRDDMKGSLGEYAEVRTFHEFCKKILHENRGGFLLYPKLTKFLSETGRLLQYSCIQRFCL
jgi:predicted NACHT family NTPase